MDLPEREWSDALPAATERTSWYTGPDHRASPGLRGVLVQLVDRLCDVAIRMLARKPEA